MEDKMLLKELKEQARDESCRIKALVKKLGTHQFGNYVLQKIIQTVADPSL